MYNLLFKSDNFKTRVHYIYWTAVKYKYFICCGGNIVVIVMYSNNYLIQWYYPVPITFIYYQTLGIAYRYIALNVFTYRCLSLTHYVHLILVQTV